MRPKSNHTRYGHHSQPKTLGNEFMNIYPYIALYFFIFNQCGNKLTLGFLTHLLINV